MFNRKTISTSGLIVAVIFLSMSVASVGVFAQGSTGTPVSPTITATSTKTAAPASASPTTVATSTKTAAPVTTTPTSSAVPATATKVSSTATSVMATATKPTATSTRAPTATKSTAKARGPSVVPAPGGPWASAFRIQNLTGNPTANCTYVFYDSAGNAVFTSPSTSINLGDSLYVYTGNPPIPSTLSSVASGQYSVVVSCDAQVAAVVNSSQGSGSGSSGDVYNSISTPSSTWYAPNIFNNYYGYYTNMIVQNTSGSPATITVNIYAPGGTTPVATQSQSGVPANASFSFDQTGLAGLSPNTPYSAVISGNGANIAPIVNIYGLGQFYTYNAFSSGSTTAYAPVIMNNYYGYNTAITVQNIGGSATNVTVIYGTGQTESFNNLTPNSSHVFLTAQTSGIPVGTLTGATITSSGGVQIVAVVNESTLTTNRATSYNAFASGTSKVSAPIVMRRYYTYNTSITCQNVGGSPTNMTLQYGGVAGTSNPTNKTNPIPAGQTAMFYQPTDSLIPDGFIGSATVSASGGMPIVCIVNEDANEAPQSSMIMDQLYGYDAINQ